MRVQREKNDQRGAFGDTNYNNPDKSRHSCYYNCAGVCLRTSGNRTRKCKQGLEVRGDHGPGPKRAGGFYNSPPQAPIGTDPGLQTVCSPGW